MIENGMQQVIRPLLGIAPEEAQKKLGSTSMRKNAKIFIEIVRDKCASQQLKAVAEDVYLGLDRLSSGRSDFLHAIFVKIEKLGFTLSFGGVMSPSEIATAVRTKNHNKRRKISDLEATRDDAAQTSCRLAHIYFCLISRTDGPSPWSGKF
jgi:hypothetical protein